MNDIIYIFRETVDLLLQAVLWLFLLRCVFGIIGMDEESPLFAFAVTVTEIFITPVRAIFDRLGVSDEMVIDLPALITMFLLALVDMLL